jgi:hypothetical protein
MLMWTISLAPQMSTFFGPEGVIGGAPEERSWAAWTLLALGAGPTILGASLMVLFVGSVALLVGWHSRLAALAVFVTLVSLERANPYVFNSGDVLLRILALLLLLAPSGAAFSLDERRRRRAGSPATAAVPAWGLRLIQLQVSVMYVSAVWHKLHGSTWRDGTALDHALALPDLARFSVVSDVLQRSDWLSAFAAYATISVEAMLAVAIWWPRARPIVLVLGVLFHLAIDASLRVGFFTLAVFVGYVSFVSAPLLRTRASGLHERVAGRRLGLATVRMRSLPPD